MLSTTSSSSDAWSAHSRSTIDCGITPIVCAPPARAAAATAPIIDLLPPPDTSVHPRAAIWRPTSAASATCCSAMPSEDAQ